MNSFVSLISRDLRLARRQGGAVMTVLGFYLVIVATLPLGLGPDLNLLSRIAPGVLWVALLLSSLLSADRMFHDDYEDGTLEIIALGPLPLEFVALAKAIAHWITVGIPLLLLAPLLALLLNMTDRAYLPLMATLAVGTPALSFIAGIGAALTVGMRKGGLLLPLLILPLYVPILIFAVSAVDAIVTGPGSFMAPFLILCAQTLAAIVLAPLAAAAALRLNLS